MKKAPRSKAHTTLTETSKQVVRILEHMPEVKRISPGVIDGKRAGKRYITIVYTRAGMELIISGQGVQKVAVHTASDPRIIASILKKHKRLKAFVFNERERIPGE